MKKMRIIIATVPAACLLVILIIFSNFGLIINNSSSLPIGLYKKDDKDKPLVKGQLVYFYFPLKEERLIKKIVATEGDRLRLNQDGVFVNGEKLLNSKPLNKDSKGFKLPKLRLFKVLEKGEVFLLGENPKSYDSRYFGSLNTKAYDFEPVHAFLVWRNEYEPTR